MGKRYSGPVSPHFDGERFISPYGEPPKSLWDVFKWKFGGPKPTPWPKQIANTAKPAPAAQVSPGQAVLTFINHATMLIQIPGLNILTDPVFSERTSPVAFAGPKRVREPGSALADLPRIDLVLVSHNHYDHLDMASLRKLQAKHSPQFLFALGDGQVVKGIPGMRLQEMDWWQEFKIKDTRVTFVPAQHWSARGTGDRNLSLWGGFMIQAADDFAVYFAGDTGYAPHFKEIAVRFPRIDLALLPIGAYEPRWFMRSQHMNPEDAVQAHLDLRAHQSIGIHFGTWQLTDEGVDEPVQKLIAAREKAGLHRDQFDILEQGETRTFPSR